jgi:hypothetical protein
MQINNVPRKSTIERRQEPRKPPHPGLSSFRPSRLLPSPRGLRERMRAASARQFAYAGAEVCTRDDRELSNVNRATRAARHVAADLCHC